VAHQIQAEVEMVVVEMVAEEVGIGSCLCNTKRYFKFSIKRGGDPEQSKVSVNDKYLKKNYLVL
jgi:hypothetical protein